MKELAPRSRTFPSGLILDTDKGIIAYLDLNDEGNVAQITNDVMNPTEGDDLAYRKACSEIVVRIRRLITLGYVWADRIPGMVTVYALVGGATCSPTRHALEMEIDARRCPKCHATSHRCKEPEPCHHCDNEACQHSWRTKS